MTQDERIGDLIVRTGSSVLGRWLLYLVSTIADMSGTPLLDCEIDETIPGLGRFGGELRLIIKATLSRQDHDAIDAETVKVIAVVDDPADSVRFTKIDKAFTTLLALQQQAIMVAGNSLLFDKRNVLLIKRGSLGPVRCIIEEILEWTRISLQGSDRLSILDGFGGPSSAPWDLEQALEQRSSYYLRLDQLHQALTGPEAAMVRQTVSPLALAAVSEDIGTMTWDARVFPANDGAGKVTLNGTTFSRGIFNIPTFYLPSGFWRGTITFAFMSRTSPQTLTLQMTCSTTTLAKAILPLSSSGIFAGDFTFEHTSPERSIDLLLTVNGQRSDCDVKLRTLTFKRADRQTV